MKMVVNKLVFRHTPGELAEKAFIEGISIIPLTVSHIESFHGLPTTHRDPFDRLLAAIAIDGNYTFLSPERELDSLGIARVW
jgi:PIN domain nuclease of toxin-antitoxin system